MLQRLVTNTGANYAFRIFTMTLGLVSLPVLVNAVGMEGYGLIVLAGTVMGYFNLLRGGVPAGTVKYVAEYEAKGEYEVVNKIVGSSLTFFACVGAVAAAGMVAFAYFGGIQVFNVSPENQAAGENVLYLAGALALFSWPGNVFGHALEGIQRYPESKFCKGLGTTINHLAAISAAWAGQSIEVIFLCKNAGMFIGVVLQAAALKWRLPTWRLTPSHFSFDVLRMIFGYSVWMLIGQVSGILIFQTDRVLLGLFLPVSSLTIYEVVTKPFIVVRRMNSIFKSAVTPAVSATEATEGRTGLDKFVYKMCKYANATIAPLAVGGVILSGPFIEIWTSSMEGNYTPYIWIAQAACLTQLFWYNTSALNNVFYGAGKVRRISLISLFSALVNVPLGVWWAQTIGVEGVILSTIVAAAVSEVLKYVLVLPLLSVSRRRFLRQAVVGGQWTSWAIGLLCIPFWSYLQNIDGWVGLFSHAALIGALFYVAVWFFVVERSHRERAYRYVTSLRLQKESA